MAYQTIVPRARIGFIIPSSNRMVEPQMARYMPDGVVPHFTRIFMTNQHKAPLDELVPRIQLAAEMLAESKCDVTVIQCTGTSMAGGVEMEARVMQTIAKKIGRPVISAASSVTAALRALNAKRLVFISESEQSHHDEKKNFLLEAGYDILADKTADLGGTDQYCIAPPEVWIDMARALRRDETDAYFISCANISSIETIATLERQLNRPVVTSNQAAIWYSLRVAGLGDVIPGLGQLMTRQIERQSSAA